MVLVLCPGVGKYKMEGARQAVAKRSGHYSMVHSFMLHIHAQSNSRSASAIIPVKLRIFQLHWVILSSHAVPTNAHGMSDEFWLLWFMCTMIYDSFEWHLAPKSSYYSMRNWPHFASKNYREH